MPNDLRFAIRQMCRFPGYSAVAVITLALGIGATTAIFSVVYAVLISPYPYGHPGEIWVPGLHSANSVQRMRPYRSDEFRALSTLPAFSSVMGTTPGSVLLSGEFAPEMITAPRLSANAFRFLEVPPILGRTFGPEDMGDGGEPEAVAVISYRLWHRLLGGDPAVLGRTLELDDRPYTVIGVMPPRFGWWTSDGLWLPRSEQSDAAERVFPIARLALGAKPAVARQQLHSLQLGLARVNPGGFPNEPFESNLTNYLDLTVASGEMQSSLQLLFGAVGALLLIACANVANLQLARASARTREMVIRLSIGARRWRLVRQLLTESMLLSVAGGVLGLGFAVVITKLMVVLMPGFYVPNEARIELNGYVLLFCVAVSMLTGILFGLMPALQSSRPNLTEVLNDEGRGSSPSRGRKLRSALVVAEMALSVVLLVSAGLTIRSFMALHSVELGFRPEHVVTLGFNLPASRYTTLEQRNRFGRELLDRVQSLPGVRAVNLGNGGLPFGGPRSPYSINGQPGPESEPITMVLVGAGYLKTLRIPLVRGRMLDDSEVLRGDRYAVINEAAAALWPAGENPLGRQIRLDLLQGPGGPVLAPTNASPDVTVIGIWANTRNDGLTRESLPAVLVPYTLLGPPDRTLALRADGDPTTLLNAVREQVRQMDAQLPTRNGGTLEEVLEDETVQPRFTMALFSLFAVVGLTLAALGIYSVISYLVTRRTREIGVRMALGARRGDVLAMILKDGGRLAAMGILVGGVASLFAVRFVASRVDLFRVRSIDPISFLSVMFILAIVAAMACWLPARRAARVAPMDALRTE